MLRTLEETVLYSDTPGLRSSTRKSLGLRPSSKDHVSGSKHWLLVKCHGQGAVLLWRAATIARGSRRRGYRRRQGQDTVRLWRTAATARGLAGESSFEDRRVGAEGARHTARRRRAEENRLKGEGGAVVSPALGNGFGNARWTGVSREPATISSDRLFCSCLCHE